MDKKTVLDPGGVEPDPVLEKKLDQIVTGIYIMQNAVVRGGEWPAGGKK